MGSCAKENGPQLQQWLAAAAAPLPAQAVFANREYEAWFLAALDSLRGFCGIVPDAAFFGDPDSVRGAKERIGSFLPRKRRYNETTDQLLLTRAMDLAAAHRRSRSFRKLAKAVGELLDELNVPRVPWPLEWQPAEAAGG